MRTERLSASADPEASVEETLQWYVRLRWVVCTAHAVLLVAVLGGLTPDWPLAALAVLWLTGTVSNAFWDRRVRDGNVPMWVRVGVVVVDVLLLTHLLHVTDGPASPLAMLYVVPVIVAAFLLPTSWAWGIVVLTGVGYTALFAIESTDVLGLAQEGGRAGQGRCRVARQTHQRGLAMAYAFAAPTLVLLVTRVRAAQQEAAARLRHARAIRMQTERLTSLATLAAGAAHELASPLSTILIVSGELKHRHADTRDQEDLQLLREEVERCREILTQLAADSGAGMGERAEVVQLRSLVQDAIEPRHRPVVVEGEAEASVPPRLVSQALRRLLGNARDASGDGELRVMVQGSPARITVLDEGEGMSPEVLAKAQEPFFTTKPEGQGMGLGLWFVASVAESCGGRLELHSEEGKGTRAVLVLGRA